MLFIILSSFQLILNLLQKFVMIWSVQWQITVTYFDSQKQLETACHLNVFRNHHA